MRHSVEELEAFNRGERSRRDYGAASIKVGSFFDWWCSEFAKSMITESGALSPEHPRWRELDRTGTTMQVISVYRKARAGFEREQLAHRIEVGDYLALGGPDSNKANHSTIVVYIDPQKRFLLTIDGNDSLNDEVRMHRRDYLIDAPTPRGEWKLTVNPYFYYLGKTDLLVRST